jgi:hypothetical protein
MTNRFGLDLPPDRVRWAAAEGVTEDCLASVPARSTMRSKPAVLKLGVRLAAPGTRRLIK